jgi:hypothetical protein
MNARIRIDLTHLQSILLSKRARSAEMIRIFSSDPIHYASTRAFYRKSHADVSTTTEIPLFAPLRNKNQKIATNALVRHKLFLAIN